MSLRYIDPPDCGCTDCLTGVSVSLSRATSRDIRKLLRGRLTSRIGSTSTFTVVVKLELSEADVNAHVRDEVDALRELVDLADVVQLEIDGRAFDVD